MRLFGITLPDNKQVQYSLTSVYGLGLSRSQSILEELKIDLEKKTKDLTEKEENAIRSSLEDITLEGDLKREVGQNVKRLKDILCYRGVRHSKRLPSKGQRTKTNSRTVRGNKRVTMGSGRRSVEKK